MKALNACALALSIAFAGSSPAQSIPTSLPTPLDPSVPSLTRSDVKADLALWRQAGLSDVALREDHGSNAQRREEALVRYQALLSQQVRAAVQPAGSATSALQVSRAEVQADFLIWRQAGLEEFSLLELRDAQPARYQQALGRYQALRASSAFSDLVHRLKGSVSVAAAR